MTRHEEPTPRFEAKPKAISPAQVRAVLHDDRVFAAIRRFTVGFVPAFFTLLGWIVVTSAFALAAYETGNAVLFVLSAAAILCLLAVSLSHALGLFSFFIANRPMIWVLRLTRYLPSPIWQSAAIAVATVGGIALFVFYTWVVYFLAAAISALMTAGGPAA